jgi:hypothetical protein
MIAAIYARKSTDQTGLADEQKSVTRQIERARAFATMRGRSSLRNMSTLTTASPARSPRTAPASSD